MSIGCFIVIVDVIFAQSFSLHTYESEVLCCVRKVVFSANSYWPQWRPRVKCWLLTGQFQTGLQSTRGSGIINMLSSCYFTYQNMFCNFAYIIIWFSKSYLNLVSVNPATRLCKRWQSRKPDQKLKGKHGMIRQIQIATTGYVSQSFSSHVWSSSHIQYFVLKWNCSHWTLKDWR